jgi:hypothetical protein
MNNRISKLAYIITIFVLQFTFPSTGSATPITWNLQNLSFSDGGTASGSFIFDADTNLYSSVNITTTAGSILGGNTYTDLWNVWGTVHTAGSLGVLTDSSPPDLAGIPALILDYQGVLTNAGGIVNVLPRPGSNSIEAHCWPGVTDCSVLSGPLRNVVAGGFVTTNPVPVPAAVWLFGSGLVGLMGFARRRKILG